ncbi:MAG: T9SS type A sorting domain-containing protein [Prevotella sp.]
MCSLLTPTDVSAFNIEKHIKWGRHHTTAFDTPRMQQIKAANAVLDGASKRVGGLTRWNPAAKADEGLKPEFEFKDLDYFGDLDGPDGKLWYYTAHFDYERVEHNNDWASYVDFIMHGYQFDIYDSQMKHVGTVKDAVSYGEHEVRVRQADLAPVVTRKFFNTDDKYEIMVGLVVNTDYYINNEYTKVYSVGGEKDAKGNDVCLMTYNEPVGDVLDASTEDKEEVYVSFISGGTDYVSTGDDDDINTNYWEKYLGNYTLVKTYAPAVDAAGPRLINTYKVKLAQLPGDMQDAPMIISYMRDGKPYFAAQYYEQPFYNRYDSYMDDMSQRDGNNLVIDIYKVSPTGFEKVQTTKLAAEHNTANEKCIASYYSIGSLQYKGDIIENGGAARDFIIDRQDYISSSDSYVSNFYRYNSNGEKTNTIFEGADSFVGMSNLPGQDPQIMFVGYDAYGDYQFNFVNMKTYATDLKVSYLMEMEDGDPERLTANMDRVAVGDSYMYATELRVPSVDDSDNNHLRVMWFDKKGKYNHIDEVNIGKNVNYATVYMSAATLDPHFFKADDNHEYMILIKRAMAGGESQEELLIGQTITDETPLGNDLLLLGPDEEAGMLANIMPFEDYLLVSYKKSVDSRDLLTARYYALPLETTGISGITGATVGEGFVINGNTIAAEGEISIFNMAGMLVGNGAGSVSLDGLKAGAYIVRAGGKAAKIIVR